MSGRKRTRASGWRPKTKLQQDFEAKAQRIHAISQLLKAYCLYEKDVQYVVQDNKVIIVDENTGRLMTGRRWSDGLHQAVEAKEGVRDRARDADAGDDHHPELFPALPEAGGHDRHGRNRGERVFRHLQARGDGDPDQPADCAEGLKRSVYKTTAREIQRGASTRSKPSTARAGRCWSAPSPSRSASMLSRMLKKEGIIHSVLNAKYHQQEAEIVARAGPARRGDHRHEHGGTRHGHQTGRRRARRGRPARDRHGAARGPAHRPPVARTLRAPGRSRLLALFHFA